MTVYGYATEGDTTKDASACVNATWRPMLNCKDRTEGSGLHAHQFLRNRGGVPPGEVYTFTLYTYTDKDPTHPSGRSMRAHSEVYVCDRRKD